MTISTQGSRNDFKGNNCTKAFAFTFEIVADSDVDVYVDNCLKTLTADYTVSGAGAATGGTVTFVTAPGCNTIIALVRDLPLTQAVDYDENDAFPAAIHEDALDKLTMLIQQVKEFATRTWRFAAGSQRAAAGYTLDEPVASRYPRVKGDCTGIEFVALTTAGTYADPVTTKGDLIVGSEIGCQERLGITSGRTLAADPNTGKPSWQPGLAVMLTNKLDAALAAGDVVGVDKGCDRAVVAANAQGCDRLFVVVPANVGDDCLALFHFHGLVRDVRASGCINRGYYVRKASSTQSLECTGIEMGVGASPAGALGVAITQAAGGLVDVIFWGRPEASHATLQVELTNKLDADLAAGDVVAIDAGCDRAVVAANAQSCQRLFVVAPRPISDDCLALFHVTGLIRQVKSTGTIARGRYVRKSATAQAVEDAGAAIGVPSIPPLGSLGIAVTAAAGGFVDVVLFGAPTFVNPEALVKAWGTAQSDGTLVESFNIASITDGGTGIVTWTWDRDFANANYAVITTSQGAAGIANVDNANAPAAGSAQTRYYNEAGTLTDPNAMHVMAAGDQ